MLFFDSRTYSTSFEAVGCEWKNRPRPKQRFAGHYPKQLEHHLSPKLSIADLSLPSYITYQWQCHDNNFLEGIAATYAALLGRHYANLSHIKRQEDILKIKVVIDISTGKFANNRDNRNKLALAIGREGLVDYLLVGIPWLVRVFHNNSAMLLRYLWHLPERAYTENTERRDRELEKPPSIIQVANSPTVRGCLDTWGIVRGSVVTFAGLIYAIAYTSALILSVLRTIIAASLTLPTLPIVAGVHLYRSSCTTESVSTPSESELYIEPPVIFDCPLPTPC